MASAGNSRDQQHPLEKQDREIVNRLLQGNPDPLNLAELARLRIRYRNFPGARDIQRDLDVILRRWQITEEQLFEKTRQLHLTERIYQRRQSEEQQDWS
ncbi:hypothetical protein NIES593_02575 [Hydrococcus rivularis NIES-593]|uniref:DUF3288 domain-containing protein n=1 Tax=Hydrococcus rivularis NIES-593 TaxID=1921803 RepID=A0A1U7HQZ4_9CYAN|nr:DUF3288 family protein [Hydrococcus rivularis]OKH25987.1 hypothetical protein NIES593_02575 [Hydrococcus rivularis NIES-593]